MFSGLVQSVSTVLDNTPTKNGGDTIFIKRPSGWKDIELGESISVSGVCLTVTKATKTELVFDRSLETIKRSVLHKTVNLERSLSVGQKIGGHLVYGHVDGLALIVSIENETKDSLDVQVWTFKAPKGMEKYIAEKGSVTLEGVSLTVSKIISRRKFQVVLIPHTLEHTNLKKLVPGDFVNFEVDMLARYCERLLENR